MLNNQISHKKDHDINSNISALINALEIVKDEWKTNPALTKQIILLASEKIATLSKLVNNDIKDD